MTHWTGLMPVTRTQLERLETYIHEPDTRLGDVFDQGEIPVDSQHKIEWIIKHDLYEGVVVHFSLMDGDATQFLAGAEATLSRASDLARTYSIEHQNRTYEVTVTENP